MLSNFLKIAFAVSALALTACDGKVQPETEDHLIGSAVQSMSSLQSQDGSSTQKIAIFDETVRRIHEFDLNTMTFLRSHSVSNPSVKHYVLYGASGNYTIDFTTKGITIFNKYGQANKNPLRFQGTPKSAAFRPDLNLLIIYDDLMTVGFLKLDANGEVVKTHTAGAAVLGNLSISAGDISNDGNLVLALSDNSLAVVDVEQTLTQKKWILKPGSPFPTGLSNIKWLAPVRGKNEQVILRSDDKVALIDLNTKTELSSTSLSGRSVQKVSKLVDAHVIFWDDNNLVIAYADNSQIQTKKFYHSADQILNSQLDLQKDSWSFVDTKYNYQTVFNDLNGTKEQRVYKSYRISDMLALNSFPVPSNVQIQLAENFMFALYPSELGYATRTSLDSESMTELKLFNVGYISK